MTSKKFSYCNTSLTIEERLDDLQGRMSVDDLIVTITPQYELGNLCGCHTGGNEEAELSPYFWLSESNTNVASACIEDGVCATTFIGPMGMGASFNRTSWRLKGSVLGEEIRAMNNVGWYRDYGKTDPSQFGYIGLTAFGPNINIARDPRFGRNSELPGEDPFLSGEYGKAVVLGMQEQDANGHPKSLAFLKHFTAYSTEVNRARDDYPISKHDLFETFLPQYEKAFVEGGATGAMCR